MTGGKSALIVGRVVLGLVSAVVLTTTGVSWGAYRQVQDLGSSQAISKGSPKSRDGAQNILVIGLTNRTDKNGQLLSKKEQEALHAGTGAEGEGGYNTNTMIILHVPNEPGSKVQGISVPRDDYVTFVDSAERAGTDFSQKKGKIKEAYGLARAWKYGELRKQGVKDPVALEQQGREAGRVSTIKNLEHLLNIHIDHFAEVSLVGFYHLAQHLGGIDVCLKEATSDTNAGANFRKGPQHLDAAQALAFVRQRDNLTNADLDRTHRQQAFLAAVTTKMKTDGVFGNISKLQGLLDVAKQDVVIDKDWDLLAFAQQAQNLTGGNAEFHTLPIKGYGKDPNNLDINLIDIPYIQGVVHTLFSPPKPTSAAPTAPAAPITTTTAPALTGSGSTVDVHNGSGEDGMAGKLGEALATRGFTKGKADSTSTPQSSTRILYGRGGQADAEKLAQLLGGITATPSQAVSAGHVAVTLGQGFTWPASLPGGSATAAATTPVMAAIPTEGAQGGAVAGNGVPCVD